MPGPPSITALVPVYNEVETVEASIKTIRDFLASLPNPFEILIIESGSTDGAAQACDSLARQFPDVTVVHEGRRNGFGSALKLGFAKATNELICVIPVDLPYSLSILKEALGQIASHDAVLSVRRDDDRSPFRKLQSQVYTVLCSMLLGLPARSPNAAFKLYRRTLIQDLPITANGWFIDTEIAYRLKERGSRVGTVAIDTLERQSGRSTVKASDSWVVLKQLLAFRKKLGHESKNRRIP